MVCFMKVNKFKYHTLHLTISSSIVQCVSLYCFKSIVTYCLVRSKGLVSVPLVAGEGLFTVFGCDEFFPTGIKLENLWSKLSSGFRCKRSEQRILMKGSCWVDAGLIGGERHIGVRERDNINH